MKAKSLFIQNKTKIIDDKKLIEQLPEVKKNEPETNFLWDDFIKVQSSLLKGILANCDYKISERSLHIFANSINYDILKSKETEIYNNLKTVTVEDIKLKILVKENNTSVLIKGEQGLTLEQENDLKSKINIKIDFM